MLRVALPKGRLKKTILQLLGPQGPSEEALLSRKLLFRHGALEFLPLKDADIPAYVERGGADVGIVGSDVLGESKADVLEPLDLGFGLCKVVFCGKPHTSLRALHAAGQLRVATKFPRTALRALKTRGLMGEVIPLSGTIEVALLTGMATAIVDLMETGRTLEENGLVVLEEVGPISARVIVNRASFWLARAKVAPFLQLLFVRAMEAGYAPSSALGGELPLPEKKEETQEKEQQKEQPPPAPPQEEAKEADMASFVRKEIRSLPLYCLADATVATPVKLNQNESPDDIPQGLKDTLCLHFSGLAWNRYPPYEAKALKENLARHVGWKADGVLLANGSNELLALLIQSVVRPGDKVALPTPCFALYAPHLEAAGATVCRVPALKDASFDEAALLGAAQGARMVLLTSPNNPTGAVLRRETLLRLLKTGALIVADEAYAEFADDNFASLLGETTPLVLLRTFSKSWAAAGLRFGFLLGPSAFCRQMQKLALPYNVSTLTLAAVSTLLERPELMRERVALVRKERAKLSQALEEMGVPFVPSQANFVLLQVKDTQEAMRHFVGQGVLLRDMSASWPSSLRVSIGNEADNEAFLRAMRSYAQQPGKL